MMEPPSQEIIARQMTDQSERLAEFFFSVYGPLSAAQLSNVVSCILICQATFAADADPKKIESEYRKALRVFREGLQEHTDATIKAIRDERGKPSGGKFNEH